MAGIADLVTALATGGRIEDDAYGREAKRIIDAQNAQAQLAKRMQEATKLTRENKGAEALPGIVTSLLTGRPNPNVPFTPEEQAAFINAFVGAGHTFTDTTSGIKNTLENQLRAGAFDASRAQGDTPFNQYTQTYQMDPIPTVEKVGDVFFEGIRTGSPTINQPFTDANAAAGAASDKSGSGKLREAKIQDAMALYGFDRGMAVKYVDKYIDIRPNPVTGRLEVTDAIDITGQRVPYTGPGANQAFPPAPPGDALAENVGTATGLWNVLGSKLATLQAMVNMPVSDKQKEMVRTQQQFQASTNQLVKAFVENPRMPVAEQQWVRQEIDLLPKVFDDPTIMLERMRSLYDNIRRRLDRYEVIINDPNMPADLVNQYQEAKINLGMFLSEMGNPYAVGSVSEGAENQTSSLRDVDIDALSDDEAIRKAQEMGLIP